MKYHVEIPGMPMVKARPKWGKGRTYTPKRTKLFEEKVRACFLQKYGRPLLDMPCRVKVWSIFGKHRSTIVEIEPIDRMKVPQKKDVDNLQKAVLDALNGIAYVDDELVYSLHAEKMHCEDLLTEPMKIRNT